MTSASSARPRESGGLLPAWNSFWHEGVPDLRRLTLFRVAFFAVLARDAWGTLSMLAPFAADFNVAHWPTWASWLPTPGLATIVVLRLGQVYLAMRMLLGVGGRPSAVLLASSFGLTYFGSQLDSYQHRYLVFLVLVACACINWKRPRESGWAVRLILVQMSLVYFWAAITKMDASWLEGDAVAKLAGNTLLLITSFAAGKLGWSLASIWILASWLVVLVELFLAVGLQFERLRWPVWIAGISLHVGFLLGKISIGLFPWYLFALYFLVIPDRLLDVPGRLLGAWSWTKRLGLRMSDALRWVSDGTRPGGPLFAAALLVGAVVLFALPVPGSLPAAVVISALALALDLTSGASLRHRALAHLGFVAALLAMHLSTETTLQLARRLVADAHARGLPAEEQLALQQRAVRQAPKDAEGRRFLAQQLREAGRTGEVVDQLEHVVRLEPESASAWTDYGAALLADGNASRAAWAYERASQLDVLSAELLVLRGVSLATAAEELEQRPELAPEAAERRGSAVDLLVKGARMHRADGKWRLAADAFARAQRLEPQRVGLMIDLARMNQAQGKTEQALSWAERALALRPTDPRARDLLAELRSK